ncbi:MAG: hypothetical protein K2H96_02755 [Muribaculaceae bacterium]|nr:hypothetical protein [Muribaculaceae bacterium]
MKKLLTYVTIALILIIGLGINAKAQQDSSQVIVSLTEENKDIPIENPWGLRMPPAPTSCIVDFTNLSITSDRLPMVLSYELWDETGETMIILYSNDYDMVTFMASLSGCYQLKLISEDNTYIGYIEL